MQQHPYSVLPLAQFNGQLIFTKDDQAPGKPFKAAWAQHHPRLKQLLAEGKTIAIQHPAHIEYIGQFDTPSNSH